ncbi:MAG: hypothetical protein QXZ09_08240 [Candidatus Methanomethylicaceae archaeon]
MIVNIEQRTPEWLRWRQKGGDGNPYIAALGGSDAPVVLGISPYKTRDQLRLEKIFGCDLTRVNEYYIERGYEWETAAPIQLGLDPFAGGPACFQSDDRPWQLASVDWFERGRVYEFKWTSKEVDESFEVPPHWYAQAQHIMDVVGVDRVVFGIAGANGVIVQRTVLRDDYFIARLRREEEEFLSGLSADKIVAVPEVDIDSLNQAIIEQLDAAVPSEITNIEEAEHARRAADVAHNLLKELEKRKKEESKRITDRYGNIIGRLSEIKQRFYDAVSTFMLRGDFSVRVPGVAVYKTVEIDVFDRDAVPDEFWTINESAVQREASKHLLPENGEWVEVMPGVRARQVKKVRLT